MSQRIGAFSLVLAVLPTAAGSSTAAQTTEDVDGNQATEQETEASDYLEVSAPEEYIEREEIAISFTQRFGLGSLDSYNASEPFATFERGSFLTNGPGPITACFIGGNRRDRESIISGARKWQVEGSSIQFDFGKFSDGRECAQMRDAALRIGFGNRGTWSLVGTAVRLSTRDRNMEFDISRIPRRGLERAATHEIGHALGLHHEHQNPNANCEIEIDWEKAKPYLKDKWKIDDEKILRNFRKLVGKDLVDSPFDEESVMNYQLPRAIFHNELFENGGEPQCFVKASDELSAGDIAFARKNYPADPNEWELNRSNARLALFESVGFTALAPEQQANVTRAAFAIDPWDPGIDSRPYVEWLDMQIEAVRAER